MTSLMTFAVSIGAVASSLVAVVAFFLAQGQAKRARQLALTSVHFDLTSGGIAAARNVMGTFRYSQKGRVARRAVDGRVTRADVIRAFFVIAWGLERADNVLSNYSAKDQATADDFIGWNIDELTRNVIWFQEVHGPALGVQNQDAWAAFTQRIRSEVLRGSIGRAQAGMTASPGRAGAPRR